MCQNHLNNAKFLYTEVQRERRKDEKSGKITEKEKEKTRKSIHKKSKNILSNATFLNPEAYRG